MCPDVKRPRKPVVKHPTDRHESSKKTLHFKNKEAYRKYNAYRYKRGVAKKSHPRGYYKVEVGGKPHKVKHG